MTHRHPQSRDNANTVVATDHKEEDDAHGGTIPHTFNNHSHNNNHNNYYSQLIALQQKLIESGFRSLKPGPASAMVYSTCSLQKDQNEEVVNWLLRKYYGNAFVVPCSFPATEGTRLVTEGFGCPGTVRFLPNTTTTVGVDVTVDGDGKQQQQQETSRSRRNDDDCFFGGGFFLAKISKRRPLC